MYGITNPINPMGPDSAVGMAVRIAESRLKIILHFLVSTPDVWASSVSMDKSSNFSVFASKYMSIIPTMMVLIKVILISTYPIYPIIQLSIATSILGFNNFIRNSDIEEKSRFNIIPATTMDSGEYAFFLDIDTINKIPTRLPIMLHIRL